MRYMRIRMKSWKMNMRDEYRAYEKALEGQKTCNSKGVRKIQKSSWPSSCRQSAQRSIYCGDRVIYECVKVSIDACAYREKYFD
jgi:IS1 family transposase